MFCSFREEGFSKFSILSEEYSKQLLVVQKIDHAHHFSYAVHSKARSTDINCFATELSCHHRTDSATTERIVSHDKILKWNIDSVTNSSQNRCADRVSHIALISVHLQDNSFLHPGLVLRMMLFTVIWVTGMGHISGDQEWSANRSEVIFLWFFGTSWIKNSLCDFLRKITIGSLSWLRTYFFMVE